MSWDAQLSFLKNKLHYDEIDKALSHLSSTNTTNIDAQQIYLDILKKKKKNIDSKYMKLIYTMFSENKACQIFFEKQSNQMMQQIDQRILLRYYCRIIQIGIRKVSYFWQNSKKLHFLQPTILQFLKQLQKIVGQMNNIKNLEYHNTMLKLLFLENSIIQQHIYQLLVNQGYVTSMDQFYRINGVDLVSDQLYSRKDRISDAIEQQQQEEDLSELDNYQCQKPQTRRFSSKNKIPFFKKNSPSKREFAQKNIQISSGSVQNKKKIKNMFQSVMKSLKNIMQEANSIKTPKVHEKQQYSRNSSKQSRQKITSSKNIQAGDINQAVITKQNRKVHKRKFSPIQQPFDARRIPKKLSIQLMSYFSNDLKSLIEQPETVQIGCFSELIVMSQSKKSKSKNNPKIETPPNIHSSQSLNLVRKRTKKGTTLDLITSNKYNQELEQSIPSSFLGKMHEFQNNNKKKTRGHKLSFKSAPGVYISINKKDSTLKNDDNIQQKQNLDDGKNLNRYLLLQLNSHLYDKSLFENEMITAQILLKQQKSNKQNPISDKKVNIAENQFGLGIGIDYKFYRERSLNINSECQLQNNKKMTIHQLKQILFQENILKTTPLNMKTNTVRNIKSMKPNKSTNSIRFKQSLKQYLDNENDSDNEKSDRNIDIYENNKIPTLLSANKNKQLINITENHFKISRQQKLYTVYDRIRRKMIY